MIHDIVPPPPPRVNDQGMIETMRTSVTWRGRTLAAMALEAGRANNLGKRECFGAPDHGDHGHGVEFEPEKCRSRLLRRKPRCASWPDVGASEGDLFSKTAASPRWSFRT